jgi:hypothetical protein
MVLGGQIVRVNDAINAWTDFEPLFTNFDLGSGAVSGGRWRPLGEFAIEWRAYFVLGSSPSISFPFGLVLPNSFSGVDGYQIVSAFAFDTSASTGYSGVAKLTTGGGTTYTAFYGASSISWRNNTPFTWAAGDSLIVQGWTETAT